MIKIEPAIYCEQMILGGLLLDPSQFAKISQTVCPKDFTSLFHEELFEAMMRVYSKNKSFNIHEIIEYLNGAESDNEYIMKLRDDCHSIANLEAHASIVREKSVHRQLVYIAEKLAKEDGIK